MKKRTNLDSRFARSIQREALDGGAVSCRNEEQAGPVRRNRPDFREGEKIKEKALKALIRAAVKLNQSKTKK